MSSRLIYNLLGFILPYHVMRFLFPSARAKESQSSVSSPFEVVTVSSSSEVKSTAAARRYISGQHERSFADQLHLLEQACGEKSEVGKDILLSSAEQLNEHLESDRRKLYTALEKLVEQAKRNTIEDVLIEEKYRIYFSAISLASPGFVEWILETFTQYPKITEHLVIEIPDITLWHSEEKIQRLAKGLQWVGAHLCIVLESGGGHRFSALSRLPLSTVKIDASYALALQQSKTTLEWVQSLRRILSSQGITLVVDQSKIQEESVNSLLASASVES